MQGKSGIRKTLATAVLAVAVIGLVDGCAGPPRRDWRQAVRAGDYSFAYSDLFETWRAGTPDIKAESLRYAWREPGIIAAARPDLASRIRELASRQAGDLASLAKLVKDGPLEDRADFAKLVDRRIDVDREIAEAFAQRGSAPPARPVTPPPVPPVAPPLANKPPTPAPHVAVPSAMPTPSSTGGTGPQLARTPATPPMPASAPGPAMSPPAAVPPASPAVAAIPAATPAPTRPASPALDRLLQDLARAKSGAVWRCLGAAACDAAWAATESFIGANSDRRIQRVTSTAIETYPPIVLGEVGMQATKSAAKGDESEIRVTVQCRAGKLAMVCPTTELRIYEAFPLFIKSAVRH